MIREPAAAAVPLAGALPAQTPTRNFLPGLAAAAVILCVYGGFALSIDVPRSARQSADGQAGFFSDEATYYMMGHSLAEDGDVTYRREDLVRVWREYPAGPTGLFLKKGRDIVDGGAMLRPPFFWTTTIDDSDPTRLFFGKSFIYPLFARPFIELFGTNGFLVFHALLLALVFWCGYAFLHARMPASISALLAGAFLLATVVPVYFVWIAPELFNFALVFTAYFCWLYKEVEQRTSAPPGMRWLFGGSSDAVAAALLGIATFSKITNAALFPPIVLWLAWRRHWLRGSVTAVVFALAAGGLFAANMAISGEWNYQGGQRATYDFEFPFQTAGTGFFGQQHGRDEALTDVIFNRAVFFTNLSHNLAWLFVGRYSGLAAYYFPAVLALAMFLFRPRRRPGWQYLALAAGIGQMLIFIIITPYTWFGGGGSVGNRYFIAAYGVFLFVFPPIRATWVAVLPWLVGGLFMAKLVLQPFAASVRPGEYADSGPLRALPVELSNVNDLPIMTNPARVRQWFGDNPGEGDLGFQVYFLDQNAYGKESGTEKSFWVKGESRAEILVKVDREMKRLVLDVTAGPVPTDVVAEVSGRSQRIALPAGGRQQLIFNLGSGYPYEGRWVWTASISSSTGFVPMFHEAGSSDTRFLGVRVKPTLQ
jgi:hypothetical protein